MLNRALGTKFRIVAGYKGTSDIHLAMQRGELDGAGMTMANALTIHGEKLEKGDLVPFFAIAAKRVPQYPNVPAMTEFGSPAEKTLMEIYASAGTIGRALAFPPGVPADRVQAMRAAFGKMLDDADFKAEVKKAKVLIEPMSGENLTAFVAKVLKTPAPQLEAARKLHQELLASSSK
jgi:tripartite-type tricarboxylate transporter receptor subunit TctC